MKTRLFYIISLSWIMLVSLQSCGLEEMYGTNDYIKSPTHYGYLYVLFYDMEEELGGNHTEAVPCNPQELKNSLQGDSGWQVSIYNCALRGGVVKLLKTERIYNSLDELPEPNHAHGISSVLLFDSDEHASYINEWYYINPKNVRTDTLSFNYDVFEDGAVSFAGLNGKLIKYDKSTIIIDAKEEKDYYGLPLKVWRRFVLNK